MNTSKERTRDKLPWWENMERKCIDTAGNFIPEFADLSEWKPRNRWGRWITRQERATELQSMCLSCPVLRECRIEFLSTVKDWDHHGVTAGYIADRWVDNE